MRTPRGGRGHRATGPPGTGHQDNVTRPKDRQGAAGHRKAPPGAEEVHQGAAWTGRASLGGPPGHEDHQEATFGGRGGKVTVKQQPSRAGTGGRNVLLLARANCFEDRLFARANCFEDRLFAWQKAKKGFLPGER